MASKSRRVTNINGAAVGPLKSVPHADSSKGLMSSAVKNAPSAQRALTQDILLAVKQIIADSDAYGLALDAKTSDIQLGRIASLMDEVFESFSKDQLETAKQEIINAISSTSTSSALKTFLLSQINELFDSDAKKEDIEELKEWIADNFSSSASSKEMPSFEGAEEEKAPTTKEKEDETIGDYKDSTVAENFNTLQTYVDKQFSILNKNLKGLPTKAGLFATIGAFIAKGFNGVVGKVAAIGRGITKGVSATVKGVGKVITAPIKTLGGVVAGPLKAIGKKIASPFKAVGAKFKSINPFASSEKKKEERKEQAKQKVMDKIANIIDKVWKTIEPFIEKVAFFMSLVTMNVIVPLSIIYAKVLLIVAAIVLVTAALITAWIWIKNGTFFKNMRKYVLPVIIWYFKFLLKSIKFLLIDLPIKLTIWIGKKLIEFGAWILEKLKQFGKWLYDNYIDKYIIQPLTRLIQPIANLWVDKIQPAIQPFIDSLMNLKEKIAKAFSAWDTNKSIWENLKNIGGIIKDSLVEWWETSPFKVFWDTKVWPMIEPFVKSLTDLKNRIVNAFKGWDSNKSIWDNLKNVGSIVWDTIKDWWSKSIFKEYWEKAKTLINDVMAPIRNWYETSALKEWIDKIVGILSPISDMVMGIYNKTVGAIKKAITGVDESKLAKNQHAEKWGAIPDNLKNISSVEEVDKEIVRINEMIEKGAVRSEEGKAIAAKNLAYLNAKKQELINQQSQEIVQQQVDTAMAPIQSLEQNDLAAQQSLAKSGKEISTTIEKKEQAQQQRQADYSAAFAHQGETMNEMRDILFEVRDGVRKPIEHVAVLPVDQSRSSAMMPAY